MISLQPLRGEHVPQVLAMNAGATPHVAPLDSSELTRLQNISDKHCVIGGEKALIGYALVFTSDHAYDGEEFQCLKSELDAPFVYIDQVVIVASQRKAGIGRQLYAAIEGVAQTSGQKWLCCEVNLDPPNPGSRAFHTRLGFELARELATRDGRVVALLKRAASNRA